MIQDFGVRASDFGVRVNRVAVLLKVNVLHALRSLSVYLGSPIWRASSFLRMLVYFEIYDSG